MYFCFPIYPSLSWSIKYILSLCLSLNAFPKTPTPPKPVNSSFTGRLDCFAFAEVCVERRYWLRCLFKSPCEETIASRLDLSLDSLSLSIYLLRDIFFLFIEHPSTSIHVLYDQGTTFSYSLGSDRARLLPKPLRPRLRLSSCLNSFSSISSIGDILRSSGEASYFHLARTGAEKA